MADSARALAATRTDRASTRALGTGRRQNGGPLILAGRAGRDFCRLRRRVSSRLRRRFVRPSPGDFPRTSPDDFSRVFPESNSAGLPHRRILEVVRLVLALAGREAREILLHDDAKLVARHDRLRAGQRHLVEFAHSRAEKLGHANLHRALRKRRGQRARLRIRRQPVYERGPASEPNLVFHDAARVELAHLALRQSQTEEVTFDRSFMPYPLRTV